MLPSWQQHHLVQHMVYGLSAAFSVRVGHRSKNRSMLQRLPADAPPIFATLNPPRPPAADKTIRRLQLAHPSFSYAAHEAQQKLHSVQVGPTPTPFCQYYYAASTAADKSYSITGVASPTSTQHPAHQ